MEKIVIRHFLYCAVGVQTGRPTQPPVACTVECGVYSEGTDTKIVGYGSLCLGASKNLFGTI